MPFTRPDAMRWNRASVALGATAWLLLVLARSLGWVAPGDLELLLLLALGVIAPLALPLASLPEDRQPLRDLSYLVILLQPIAALIGGASFLPGAGPLAAALAAVWLLFSALAALTGILRLVQGGRRLALADACPAAALIYLPIGGVWLVLARWGIRPLGFSPTTVLLTAVHFHFITLGALVITGLTGRAIQATHGALTWQAYRVAALGMLVNPLLVAAGITITQTTGVRLLESAAAVLLALSLLAIALLSLRFVVPVAAPPVARWPLVASSAAVLITMPLAGAYAIGAATGAWTLTIAQMIAAHGWLNALGFSLCGLIGWRLSADRSERAEGGDAACASSSPAVRA